MNNLYILRKAAAERRLDELDPEWRSRFFGDWQRAEEFYRARRVSNFSAVEPPDVDFDNDLEDRDEH